MADFSITISNSLNTFGPAPSTQWGTGTPYTMTWGVSKWGEGTQDLMADVGKFLAETLSLADSFYKSFEKVWSDSIASAMETSSEGLSDGSGWNYVFVSNTTEGESRASGSYSASSAVGTSYSSQAAGSTTWSQA